ncbi:MAG: arginyltransferase [Gammaproteobacteria bacterium]|nr:arginyltransferase [Gammaproteobacteria bacterium]
MEQKFLRKPINLYLSAEHDCSYLPDRQANSLFVDPEKEMTSDIYSQLIQQGFRRSGNYVYTPYCKKCHDCIPIRLNVKQFVPSRSQKRCRNKNKNIEVQACSPVYDNSHYQIYSDYVTSRHAGGGMDEPDNDKYLDFLTSNWAETIFFEFSKNDRPIGVAVTDQLENGLSAVYTFFDPSPECQKQSPGVFSILWQIEEAKRRDLEWLYLGYWIKNCTKMSYKDNYQPLEYFYNHHWNKIPPDEFQ